jgi:hypothetical protein
MRLDLDAPIVITIDDDPLPNGRNNRLSLTVWTLEESSAEDRKRAARAVAIGFLERTLEALKRQDVA